MSRDRVLTRIAWWGLFVFIVGLTALSAWSAVRTRNLTEDTRVQVTLSDGWKQARYWIAEEETLERKYRLEPGPKRRAYHAESVSILIKTAQRLREDTSTPSSLRAIDRLLVENARYVRAMQAMFDAVDRHDLRRVEAIHVAIDPTYDRVEGIARVQEAAYNRSAYRTLAQLDKMQRRAEYAIPLLAVGGLSVLGLFFLILRRLRRRLDAAVLAKLETLEAVASSDALTGLGNHRTFQEAIRREFVAVRANDVLQLAIVDCDEFKLVNDRNGHRHGDAVLQAFGQAVRLHGLGPFAYRIGGDEFAFVAKRSERADFVLALHRLGDEAPGAMFGTTISVGIAVSDGVETVDELHDRADIALYEAKRRGRKTTVTFDASMMPIALPPEALHRRIKHVNEGVVEEQTARTVRLGWQAGRTAPAASEA